MQCTFLLRRSNEWTMAKRLRTGENVPMSTGVTAELVELSESSRRILLEYGHGAYPKELKDFRFSKDYVMNSGASYGVQYLYHDGDKVTPAEIDVIIALAIKEIDTKREAWQVQMAARDAKVSLRKQKQRMHEAEIKAARELLRDEIADFETELTEAKNAQNLLSEFLGVVPQDALCGALRILAGRRGHEVEAGLQEEIENAAPHPYEIFDHKEDEEDDKPAQGQQGNIREIRLPCYNIVLRLQRKSTASEQEHSSITSSLKGSNATAGDRLYNAAIDGIESMILSHACAGIHVELPEYIKGVETAVEAVANYFS